jgi:AraC family transcriptional regulator
MEIEELEHGSSEGPLAELRKIIPYEAAAASDRLGWVGVQAARYYAAPASELYPPSLAHPRLVYFSRPPVELDLVYEGVRRRVPPPARSVSVIPAGASAHWRWSGPFDWLHVVLDQGLVTRVAAEGFGLDPARLVVPPLDGQDHPQFRALMGALDTELTTGGAGGALAAESLANVLAVHLIRQALGPRQIGPGPDGRLPRARLRAIVEFIEENLDARPSLGQMADIAQVSPYHFARQFKAAMGQAPYQYVITRRVERARQLLQKDPDLSLAEVATFAGFSDQSQFSYHFKRLVGTTPGQFRSPAKIA